MSELFVTVCKSCKASIGVEFGEGATMALVKCPKCGSEYLCYSKGERESGELSPRERLRGALEVFGERIDRMRSVLYDEDNVIDDYYDSDDDYEDYTGDIDPDEAYDEDLWPPLD